MTHRTFFAGKTLWTALLGALFLVCAAALLFPAPGVRAEEHTDHTGWTVLTAAGGTLESGRYVLEEDLFLTNDLTLADGAAVTLCLNGRLLWGTGAASVITIPYGTSLTLCDCDGAASHAYYRDANGMYVFDDGSDEWDAAYGAASDRGTLSGGAVTGGAHSGNGGGVSASGTFVLESGAIAGNAARQGGGLWIFNPGTTLNGGSIEGNYSSSLGGGIYAQHALTLNDCTIRNNVTDLVGGGISCINGDFVMNGGLIEGNASTYTEWIYDHGCGGVFASTSANFVMNGGRIQGNTSAKGSSVGTDGGSLTIDGGYLADSFSSEGVRIVSGYFSSEPDSACVDEDSVALRISHNDPAYSVYGSQTHAVYRNGYKRAIFGELVYDGGALEAGTDFTIEEPFSSWTGGYSLSWYTADGVQLDGPPSGAGDYRINVHMSVGMYAEKDGKKYYTPLGDNYYDFTILPAALTVSTPDLILTYGDEAPEYELSYEGFVNGEGTDDLTVLPQAVCGYQPGTPVGTLEIGISGGEADNYTFVYVPGTLTVEKATYDMTGVTFEDLTVTYDGTEKSVLLSGELPQGLTVTYQNNAATDAGTYEATASFAGDEQNFHPVDSMTAVLTIEKAAYDMTGVTFEDLTTTYDGTEKSVLIAGELPQGLTVTYQNNAATDAGTYEATASFAGDEQNFHPVDSMTAVLTIEKATYDMAGVTFEDLTTTYDGTEKSVLIEGELPQGLTVTYQNNAATDAGTYEATASFAGDEQNFHPVNSMTAVLTIEKADPAPSFIESLTIRAGQTISEISLPSGWRFAEDESFRFETAGTFSMKIVFTPEDTRNYNTLERTVQVTVETAEEAPPASGCGASSIAPGGGAALLLGLATLALARRLARR